MNIRTTFEDQMNQRKTHIEIKLKLLLLSAILNLFDKPIQFSFLIKSVQLFHTHLNGHNLSNFNHFAFVILIIVTWLTLGKKLCVCDSIISGQTGFLHPAPFAVPSLSVWVFSDVGDARFKCNQNKNEKYEPSFSIL